MLRVKGDSASHCDNVGVHVGVNVVKDEGVELDIDYVFYC